MPQITGHTGKAPEWSPALRRRPRLAADHGKPIGIDGWDVVNVTDADAVKIDAHYEWARGRYWQASEIVVNRLTVRGVKRTRAGEEAKLHCDCVQIRNTGEPINAVLKDVVLDPQSPCDGAMIEGSYRTLMLDNVQTLQCAVKVKPGHLHYCDKIVLTGGQTHLIVYPGVMEVEWDGLGMEPKADGGATFVLTRIPPKHGPKKCPACNGTGVVPVLLLFLALLLTAGSALAGDSRPVANPAYGFVLLAGLCVLSLILIEGAGWIGAWWTRRKDCGALRRWRRGVPLLLLFLALLPGCTVTPTPYGTRYSVLSDSDITVKVHEKQTPTTHEKTVEVGAVVKNKEGVLTAAIKGLVKLIF